MRTKPSRWIGLSPLLAVLTLAACTGSPGPSVATAGNTPEGRMEAPSADPQERARQFVACMRANGVEIDESSGAGRGGRIAVPTGAPEVETAMEKCRIYLPDGGEPGQLSPDDIERHRLYAKCMRENGVPEYPDPNPATGVTELGSDLSQKMKNDPSFLAASEACRSVLGSPGAATPGMVIG
jgi:hypothetical protein